jgi:hypothetical protein
MIAEIREISGFLSFWLWDLVLETFYAIFRCRPRKLITGENILITGTGEIVSSRFVMIFKHKEIVSIRCRYKLSKHTEIYHYTIGALYVVCYIMLINSHTHTPTFTHH